MTTEEIKSIKEEMFKFYRVDLSLYVIGEYVRLNSLDVFDTWEREAFISFIAKKVTGMDWPANGDSKEHKDIFYKKWRSAPDILLFPHPK